ncbi:MULTISPECIES: FAD-dependent oxidoreductase [Actinosynnema]|uniref:FAD-dependent oxidoreductase n=1 Tax=Actinosynnema TaxID=40566 RepID=UPI0020A3EEA4|nr:FAD-dependent oxidoreductase [Actinosynnema pretiosum]MCP2094514.1 Dehydrogenase (flavoprotein) [Actinosynnema pretiosum]
MKQRTSHVVVLGGGLAGMLAATVLAEHADRVTVVERDDLAADPVARPGLPQHRHAHLLPSTGVRALEALLPGVVDALVGAGAHRIALPTDLLALTPSGWRRRFPGRRFALTCSRGLVDRQVRRRVFVEPAVELLDGVEVTGLLGDARRITGVRVRGGGSLRADLVVDATGRGANAPGWLAGIGAPAPEVEVVDRAVVCASRAFTAPASARSGFPAVTTALDPRTGAPGRASLLTPVEDGRWLVTLVGSDGVEPPSDGAGFAEFARALATPLVAELMAAAEPDGGVHLSRATANHRHRYERMSLAPVGFLVLGDALSAVDPVHAHGMASAARSALALRAELRAHGLTAGPQHRAQRVLARAARPAWTTATARDRLDPDPVTRVRRAVSRRLPATAALPGSAAGLAHPRVLSALLRGGPPDGGGAAPPFTAEERAAHPFLGARR